MSTHASIWTPRRTNRLWPRPKQKYTIKATPYTPPPPPPPLKKPPPPAEQHTSADVLEEKASVLIAEAEALEAVKPSPSVRMQLGLYLLEKEDAIKSVLKSWDTKGRGEFLRAEFRLNLRGTGIQATSGEADGLFDSWDDDGGGSLDLKELRRALLAVQDEARRFKAKPDPNSIKAHELRRRAAIATEAANASTHAEQLEEELAQLIQEIAADAAVQLGNILVKRRIKPGAVVTSWAKSRGAHSGELSKAEFREQVLALGLASTGCSANDIDVVFDTFDADGGGYMDAEEAAAMIKGLQATAEAADQKKRAKERSALAMRAKAAKKAEQAQAPVPEPEPLPVIEEVAGKTQPSERKKAKKKKEEDVAAAPQSSAPVEPLRTSAPTPAPTPAPTSAPSSIGSGIGNAIGGLFGGGGETERRKAEAKAREAKARQEAETQKVVLMRLQKLIMWRAMFTWIDVHEALKTALAVMRLALLRWRHAHAARGFETWLFMHQGLVEAKYRASVGARQWKKMHTARGWRAWSEWRLKRRRAAERERKVMSFASRLKQPAVGASFGYWRAMQRLAARGVALDGSQRCSNPCVMLANAIGLASRRCGWFCTECWDVGEPTRFPRR